MDCQIMRVKTKNPAETGFLYFKRSGSENELIVSQARRKQLNLERLRILSELEQLADIPKPEQTLRYYRIKPRLVDVYREMAEIHGKNN